LPDGVGSLPGKQRRLPRRKKKKKGEVTRKDKFNPTAREKEKFDAG